MLPTRAAVPLLVPPAGAVLVVVVAPPPAGAVLVVVVAPPPAGAALVVVVAPPPAGAALVVVVAPPPAGAVLVVVVAPPPAGAALVVVVAPPPAGPVLVVVVAPPPAGAVLVVTRPSTSLKMPTSTINRCIVKRHVPAIRTTAQRALMWGPKEGPDKVCAKMNQDVNATAKGRCDPAYQLHAGDTEQSAQVRKLATSLSIASACFFALLIYSVLFAPSACCRR
eukprot:g47593.t1